MASIGFIGVGTMGGSMMAHLVADGHDVTAFDADDDVLAAATESGARPAEDAHAAAKRSEVVFLSLPDPPAVRAVVDGIADALDPGDVLIDTTTSTPATTDEIADQLDDRGVDVLGAPVSGGASGAREGTLAIMVGGDPAVYAACEPLFEAFGDAVFHVGERPGHGHAVKLLNNYLAFASVLSVSEAVTLGREAGIDPKTLMSVVNESSGRSNATERTFPEYVLADEDIGFQLGLMAKDIRLCVAFAEDAGTPMLLANVVRQLVGYAHAAHGDDADLTRVADFVARLMSGE